ncbi:cytochrome c-type biogenesis protein [Rubrimonas sp.]|uniref:cytochrome c-type biogenesis protein n=1 Tax=Rubrimonas sp. TaxID=2036015 RepID=UPI002FDED5F7
MNWLRGFLLALALLAGPAAAVQPDEMLDDPVLEARARDISAGLRCLVCRNESIDDSNADFARTMRLLVRERLTEGDSDAQAVSYIVDRYGEYVLLTPRLTLANAFIWLSGPALLLFGGWTAWRYLKAREAAGRLKAGPAPLSEDEQKQLASLLDR